MNKKTRGSLWERHTEALIAEQADVIAEAEKRKDRARREIDAADMEIAAAERVREALGMTLALYRSKAGSPKGKPVVAALPARTATGRPTTRDLVLSWAREHDGTVRLAEAVSSFVEKGYFDSANAARNVLCPFLLMPPSGVVSVRVERGVYDVGEEAVEDAA